MRTRLVEISIRIGKSIAVVIGSFLACWGPYKIQVLQGHNGLFGSSHPALLWLSGVCFLVGCLVLILLLIVFIRWIITGNGAFE